MIETMGSPAPVATHPRYLECDCCGSMADRLWVYTHYGFGLRLHGEPFQFDAGAWGFCVYCHVLFPRELPILVARVVSLCPGSTPELLTPVYSLLAQCVFGEPITWEAGEPYRKIWPEEPSCSLFR
jgi:hypothetical protein